MKPEFSAGGVVLRRFHGRPYVAVITTKNDALALPKGHPDRGEDALQAALREVREETGIESTLVEKLGDVRYWYQRSGRRVLKVVSFFLFEYRSGDVADHDEEIEEARWMPIEKAASALSYRGEREMVARALSRLGPDR